MILLTLLPLLSFAQEFISPFPNATFSLSAPSQLISPLRSSGLEGKECPPCEPTFNCVLPSNVCLNNGLCNSFNGNCECPAGFGGNDCGLPLCGSLADGSNRFPREGKECACEEGWGGINCNVCETNQACNALVGSNLEKEVDAVCYKEGYGIKEMFQVCDVTNRKIVEMLPERKPQVTFTCNIPSRTCGFQFWIGQVESFYCGLSNCTANLEIGYESNTTSYDCKEMECACIPGRMLCGEDGSVDISEFLTEEIKGPAKFIAKSGKDSQFEEPAMNQLINDIFGDSFITIDCKAGECMRSEEVPGFVIPPRPGGDRLVALSIGGVALIILSALFMFWHFGRASKQDYSFLTGRILLPSDEDDENNKSLFNEHIPAALQFSELSYTLPNGKKILSNITGSIQPGQIMAIIGASGAGKSSLLDILAKKSKQGSITGKILVNGKEIEGKEYKRVVGFVDQEDILMSTLTVYETVLFSALLRLPAQMQFEEKKVRTIETLMELGIFGIRDSRIGDSGDRGISGGEKRRVSIACELVTSPSILFLDEPTSGLDSYNAINVVESLLNLSRTYNRTVIFTIHQPRSNIVALFDKLILLAAGKLIYSGDSELVQNYFDGLGWKCPAGYNIADYLIDLTMQNSPTPTSVDSIPTVSDPELGVTKRARLSVSTVNIGATELDTRPNSSTSSSTYNLSSSTPTILSSNTTISPRILSLAEAYTNSAVAKSVQLEIESAISTALTTTESNHRTNGNLKSYEKANYFNQFKILSGRAFKNLYRNPMLMLSHYLVAVVVACICGFLFRNLTNDIPGFQNRMGLFFFILSLFGFGSLSSLNVFGVERLLFIRERSNEYYNPIIYFFSKLLFDILPLRIIPPFILGMIVYYPVGLVPSLDSFWRFILILILFNLSASSTVLLLSVLVKNTAIANLVGSLIMLFNLLFAGLLINKDKLPLQLQFLETISFFHAAFEGLLVNEVRYLQLKDHRYGVDIEVPAATILSMFGFQAQAFWFPDVVLLASVFCITTTLAAIGLILLVKERR